MAESCLATGVADTLRPAPLPARYRV